MIRTDTNLLGCFTVTPTVYKDSRGLFFEAFHQSKFEQLLGEPINFVQDNHSFSKRGVLRGLHYQKGEHAQAKLVRVITGKALDVVVDLRSDSPTYGQHYKTILSGENGMMLFIPRGMAHGFLALEDNTIFTYKCDNYYSKTSEAGINYKDPELNINWDFPKIDLILSEKDANLPFLNALKK